jgi:hypothetical protein
MLADSERVPLLWQAGGNRRLGDAERFRGLLLARLRENRLNATPEGNDNGHRSKMPNV